MRLQAAASTQDPDDMANGDAILTVTRLSAYSTNLSNNAATITIPAYFKKQFRTQRPALQAANSVK